MKTDPKRKKYNYNDNFIDNSSTIIFISSTNDIDLVKLSYESYDDYRGKINTNS